MHARFLQPTEICAAVEEKINSIKIKINSIKIKIKQQKS